MIEKPVLIVDVELDEIYEVNGKKGQASMLLFHGTAKGDNFIGRILPGAVDTQKELAEQPRLLSARYIIQGEDSAGNMCHIFIENNSVPGSEYTKPIIYTDSEELQWLETADLYGTLCGKPNGVIISFFKKPEE